jgi:hypothetical protein
MEHASRRGDGERRIGAVENVERAVRITGGIILREAR